VPCGRRIRHNDRERGGCIDGGKEREGNGLEMRAKLKRSYGTEKECVFVETQFSARTGKFESQQPSATA